MTMQITVDGKPLEGGLRGANLEEMLVELSEEVLSGQRSFTEVKINGRPYNLEEMGPSEEILAGGITSLEVDTIEAQELARRFLLGADEFLGPLCQAVPAVAELFALEDEQEANERYLQLLESLQMFMQVLDAVKEILTLDLDAVREGHASARERLDKINQVLGELLSSQERQDWVLLADVLRYDLLPELEAWRRLMPRLREQITS